jgi:hypothetical protein
MSFLYVTISYRITVEISTKLKLEENINTVLPWVVRWVILSVCDIEQSRIWGKSYLGQIPCNQLQNCSYAMEYYILRGVGQSNVGYYCVLNESAWLPPTCDLVKFSQFPK